MNVYTIVCFNRVLAYFYRAEDAYQAVECIRALCGMPCLVVSDSVSKDDNFVWKDKPSQSLVELLELLSTL